MAPMLGAVGLGVADMSKSLHFYTQTLPLGLTPTQEFDVSAFKEVIIALPPSTSPSGKRIPTGSQIILMQYKDGRIPHRQQGKLVFYVDDVADCMKRCKAAGAPVFLEVGQAEEEWARGIGMVRDPDGFLVEFIPTTQLRRMDGVVEKPKI